MTDKVQETFDALVKAKHPTKKVEGGGARGGTKIKAPDGKPSKKYKAWRAAKAEQRRPEWVE